MCIIEGLPEELSTIIDENHEKYGELVFLLQKVFDTGFILGGSKQYPDKYDPTFWDKYVIS